MTQLIISDIIIIRTDDMKHEIYKTTRIKSLIWPKGATKSINFFNKAYLLHTCTRNLCLVWLHTVHYVDMDYC